LFLFSPPSAAFIAGLIVFFLCFGTPAAVFGRRNDNSGGGADFVDARLSGTSRYLIRLAAPPAAYFKPGNPPLIPGRRRNDPADFGAYRAYLDRLQENIVFEVSKRIGRNAAPSAAFTTVINAVVLELRPAEASKIAAMPKVAAVYPDRLHRVTTDAGPAWVGAPGLWEKTPPNAGEGIVVGIIDTGVNPENPAFADIGLDGYDHTNPRGRYYGVCDSQNEHYDPTFPCNDKLIGAYAFDRLFVLRTSPIDDHGHGSHTASTAAGNFAHAEVPLPGKTIEKTVSGVAPHASIISYKALSNGSGFTTELVAAIEQAVTDGVDVINYSIGTTFPEDPYESPIALAFLAARESGVFVAASAGNNGPRPGSIGTPGNAPWVTTAANISHDRRFVQTLLRLERADGVSLPDIAGTGITGGYGPAPIVWAGDYENPNDPDDPPEACAADFPAGTFSGEIVVCEAASNSRERPVMSAAAGGAGAVALILREGGTPAALQTEIPGLFLSHDDGASLLDWLQADSGHSAEITAAVAVTDSETADRLSRDSARGPNPWLPDIIKPDLAAPGTDILAAGGKDGEVRWEVFSGTSMASPHVAGAAALLRTARPAWTPAGIHSALVLTARPVATDGDDPAGPHAAGAGRLDISAAAAAGFVLPESGAGFEAADPDAGGLPEQLNLPALGNDRCVDCLWVRTLKSTREVDVDWTATFETEDGFTLSATPSVFTLPANASRIISVNAAVGRPSLGDWFTGRMILTPDSPDIPTARFPVAAKCYTVTAPKRISLTGEAGSHTVSDIEAVEITGFTADVWGPVPGAVHEVFLYEDPDRDDPLDHDIAAEYGTALIEVTVPAGSRRLIAEIAASAAPDTDLYLHDELTEAPLCESTSPEETEFCALEDPPPGVYRIVVHNWAGDDEDGGLPDRILAVTAVIPAANAGYLTAALAEGGPAIPSGKRFDLLLTWDLPPSAKYWYAALSSGTDPSHPADLGTLDVTLRAPWPLNAALRILTMQPAPAAGVDIDGDGRVTPQDAAFALRNDR
jgi:subtilisin family serine protease